MPVRPKTALGIRKRKKWMAIAKCFSFNTNAKNYENLIIQIQNFIIEHDTRNLKFTMFHADDRNPIKMYKCIIWKIEWDSVVTPVSTYLYKLLCILFITFLTRASNDLQKLMPLVGVCVKVDILENWIFRIF